MDRAFSPRLGRSLPSLGVPRVRGVAVLLWRRPRLRLALLCALGALALGAGGWLVLRNSSLAAVQRVRISGVHGADAAQIEAALEHAARGMSTLDVKRGALLVAVARFHVVRELTVTPSFPHGLRIRVSEQLPVAVLLAGGIRTAVAADGVVLGPGLLGGALPSVNASGAEPLPGQRVAATTTRAELSVLGAAPSALLGWVQRVFTGPEGLTVQMRGGLAIYFGNATRAHAKWLAAARVLADPGSAGATYVDVRLPERPAAGTAAAGGFATSASAALQVGASDPSAAALAATLDEAVAGGANTSAAAATPSEPAAAASAPSGSSAAPSESAAPSANSTAPIGESPAAAAPGAEEPSASTSG
ncbi:MAG TPA: FtsQ-type POTRA domain-containing protein [Solirubrobacteraceae bacterium]|jgi:cell division protein FtsQ|nr:FtsQ-type POTRA domain-containing protein [Solirubrobacteraceae bacterium]